jgi:hypothetical protein
MILDIEMLRSFYASYSESVKQAKATVKRPLTYAEKVLFAHLFDLLRLRRKLRIRWWQAALKPYGILLRSVSVCRKI